MKTCEFFGKHTKKGRYCMSNSYVRLTIIRNHASLSPAYTRIACVVAGSSKSLRSPGLIPPSRSVGDFLRSDPTRTWIALSVQHCCLRISIFADVSYGQPLALAIRSDGPVGPNTWGLKGHVHAPPSISQTPSRTNAL